MSYHLKWLRPTPQETTGVGKNVDKRNSCALLVGMQTGAATMENNREVPQNIKNRIAI